jgi:uncharacterized SAM-binding protein YcdF (DUF218 family)
MKRSQPSSKRRLGTRVGLVAAVFVFADLLCTHLYLDRATEFAASQQPVKTEVGIVLFGDFRGGALGAETLRRVAFAARQFETGGFERILCAGGARPARNLYGSELMKSELLRLGIPLGRVFTENVSKDTPSNVDEALKVVEGKGWNTATLLSSPLHVYRVRELLQGRSGSPRVFLAAYGYGECRPEIDWKTLWRQTHYEWGARLLQGMLPARFYQRLIEFIRS